MTTEFYRAFLGIGRLPEEIILLLGSEVYGNTQITVGLRMFNNTSIQSAAMGLAHELGHAAREIVGVNSSQLNIMWSKRRH